MKALRLPGAFFGIGVCGFGYLVLGAGLHIWAWRNNLSLSSVVTWLTGIAAVFASPLLIALTGAVEFVSGDRIHLPKGEFLDAADPHAARRAEEEHLAKTGPEQGWYAAMWAQFVGVGVLTLVADNGFNTVFGMRIGNWPTPWGAYSGWKVLWCLFGAGALFSFAGAMVIRVIRLNEQG